MDSLWLKSAMKPDYRFAIFLAILLAYSRYYKNLSLGSTFAPKPNAKVIYFQGSRLLDSMTQNSWTPDCENIEYRGRKFAPIGLAKRIYLQDTKVLASNISTITLTPECENVLENLTSGRWIKKVDLRGYEDKVEDLIRQEEIQVCELKNYWEELGIQSESRKKGLLCGYKK